LRKQKRFIQRKAFLWVLIFTITLIWGYAWVMMKASLNFMGPFTYSSFRFGTGTITMFIILFIFKIGFPDKKYWKHLFINGLLQTAAVFLLVMFAMKFVDAGKSSVLLYSMPIWSSFLAVKFLGEKLNLPKFVGLLLGLIGLIFIVGWDLFMISDLNVIIGELLIISAAICWAFANIYYRIHLIELPQIQVSTIQMFFGTVIIILFTIQNEWGEPIIFNLESIYYILFTGIFASALCFTVWFIIISKIDIATATISTLLVPVFGLLFSSLLLGEKLTPGILSGSLLIITGIIIATKKKRSIKKRLEDTANSESPKL
jgi:drug/metabolite transporter (DMT)-like permease